MSGHLQPEDKVGQIVVIGLLRAQTMCMQIFTHLNFYPEPLLLFLQVVMAEYLKQQMVLPGLILAMVCKLVKSIELDWRQLTIIFY